MLFPRDVVTWKPLSLSEYPHARSVSGGETLLFHLGTRWVEVFFHLTKANKVSHKYLAHIQALLGNLVQAPTQAILFQPVINLELPKFLVGILSPRRGYLFWQH